MSGKDLTPMQASLWKLFNGVCNRDISITDMYDAVYNEPVRRATDTREMQQKLGPILQRLNRKLYGQHIVPGDMKRTYRLVAKQPV